MTKVKILREVLIGDRIHAVGDLVELVDEGALRAVEWGAAELVGPLTHTVEGLDALRHRIKLAPAAPPSRAG